MKWQENTGNDTVLNDMLKRTWQWTSETGMHECILFDSICITDRLWHSQFFLTDPDLVQKCSMMCSSQIPPRTPSFVFQVFSFQVSGQTQRPNTRPAWCKVRARKPQTIFPPEFQALCSQRRLQPPGFTDRGCPLTHHLDELCRETSPNSVRGSWYNLEWNGKREKCGSK